MTRQPAVIRQFSEILSVRQQRPPCRNSESQHVIVGSSRVRLGDPHDVEAGVSKRLHCRTRKVLVGEEAHAGSSGKTFSLFRISLAYAMQARTSSALSVG